jgi:4-hydroxymandelate oxidase
MPDTSPTPPEGITCAADYEALALARLEPAIAAWLSGGSGDEQTLRANREAFAKLRVYNRVLRDVSAGQTQIELLGHRLAHPMLLAPVAYHGLLHADAELASARAAAATDTPMVLSTQASRTIEEVADVGPQPRWLQLYLQPRREDTLALVRRAEAAGYSALVLTLDAPVQAPNRRAQALSFRLPAGIGAINLAQQSPPPPIELGRDDSLILRGYMREAPQRADIEWLRAQTNLPILAKGLSHPEDAVMLLDLGCAGLIVSNHGGRALDGVPASLELLPAIRSRVGGVPLLMDGGIRSGGDVFKALACGADAVLLGRLPLYGLAVAGALGMAHVLKLLREEFELCMALSGCARIADIDDGALFDPLPGVPAC